MAGLQNIYALLIYNLSTSIYIKGTVGDFNIWFVFHSFFSETIIFNLYSKTNFHFTIEERTKGAV